MLQEINGNQDANEEPLRCSIAHSHLNIQNTSGLATGHEVLDDGVTLGWILKDVPCIAWDILEGVLEAFVVVLGSDSNRVDVRRLSDEDEFDPAFELLISNSRMSACCIPAC